MGSMALPALQLAPGTLSPCVGYLLYPQAISRS